MYASLGAAEVTFSASDRSSLGDTIGRSFSLSTTIEDIIITSSSGGFKKKKKISKKKLNVTYKRKVAFGWLVEKKKTVYEI